MDKCSICGKKIDPNASGHGCIGGSGGNGGGGAGGSGIPRPYRTDENGNELSETDYQLKRIADALEFQNRK